MATPHIDAQPGAFADTVLMPGDPLRAQFIAETFLDDVECVTRVRNMLGFTGTYQGRRISVMGSGMGIPSCSIYAKELITEYGVERLVRVGSCGAVRDDVAVNDIVIGMGASTDSGVNRRASAVTILPPSPISTSSAMQRTPPANAVRRSRSATCFRRICSTRRTSSSFRP